MDTPNAPLLAAEAVEVSFGTRPVLRGVDLDIHAGDSVALVGPGGSGCSTLLRALNRTEPVDAGEIRFRGEPLPAGGTELATLRADVALVLPTYNLPPHQPVREAIIAASRRVRGWSADDAAAATDAALARVGASQDAATPAGEVRGAAALRAAVGRALALDAQVLLLDDPTSILDPAGALQLRTLLADLAGTRTLVLTTGGPALVDAVATRVVRLEDGRVVADGPVDEVGGGV